MNRGRRDIWERILQAQALVPADSRLPGKVKKKSQCSLLYKMGRGLKCEDALLCGYNKKEFITLFHTTNHIGLGQSIKQVNNIN